MNEGRRNRTAYPRGTRPGPHSGWRESLVSVVTALGVVLCALASCIATAVAVWVAVALARGPDGAISGATAWTSALVLTLVVPVLLAVWRNYGDLRRIGITMVWLPLLWNAGVLMLFARIVPDMTGTALRRHGAWVAAKELGDSHPATRVLAALAHRTADLVTPPPTTPRIEAPPLEAPPLQGGDHFAIERAISVPFGEGGNAIFMDVELGGPSGRVSLPYLFDTGASFTTLTRRTAARLGIAVPDDAPTLKFNTASGPRESKMVYLPSLGLRGVTITGLLVSVCDSCANDRTEGLLGLNVMREFDVHMDYKRAKMTLVPSVHAGRPNRAYDIEPVVDMQIEGVPEVWLGRVHWIVTVENRGSHPIEGVVPAVKFAEGPTLVGQSIARIDPGAVGRSLVEGEALLDSGRNTSGLFTLSLAEASW